MNAFLNTTPSPERSFARSFPPSTCNVAPQASRPLGLFPFYPCYHMLRFTPLLLLLVAPVAVHAQSGSPVATHTDGFFFHARFGGLGIALEDADDDGSLGLRAGYGFSDRFTLCAGLDIAEPSSTFEGPGDGEGYGLIYLKLMGARLHLGAMTHPFAWRRRNGSGARSRCALHRRIAEDPTLPAPCDRPPRSLTASR